MAYPRAFSHVGISVPNLEKAIDFYHNVLGWYIIQKPFGFKEGLEVDERTKKQNQGTFGAGWKSFRMVHMATSDGIGIELFEFNDWETPKNNFNYKNIGIFHFAVQDPDIEGLVKKIVDHGGKQRMPITTCYHGKPYKMCYVEDPFGVVFEIYTHSYEITCSEDAAAAL